MRVRGSFLVVLVLGLSAATVGCGGGADDSRPRTPPDLAAFLRLPVATPTTCPTAVSTASGRRSPWVGHVDISVFVEDKATPARVRSLRSELSNLPDVSAVYFESRAQAYAEFQRLYTCSAEVPQSAVRASYRLVLDQVTRPERNRVVRAIYRLPGVGSVSCDPSSPCTDVSRP